jgi:hypothetical protein
MNYLDGGKVQVGDQVELWSGKFGRVVCSIDDEIYTSDYPEQDWAYMKKGIMVKMDNGELMHYSEEDPDLKFIQR